ncbi:ABC transporter permease [Vibrio sp. SS-MA-C1-2]|uniref:ABC transporter permease n=1 Tax=Vibrio sp. SS-MA-C1-2 TaxID=2908646 RepID=UPI001F19403D|nr:ABC transporter permease [Vibrio sp. SS-MA-C1-2]UJF17118.1 ABC transporter permease [Vibrio sp. SS-MA-C1-2]
MANLLNFRLSRLWALMIKESLQIIRDPSAIIIAFILPVVLLALFATSVSLDIKKVPIGVVRASDSRQAISLSQAFSSSRYFNVMPVRDKREIEEKLVAGELNGYVVIPADFDKKLSRNEMNHLIQIISDGSQPNTANFVVNYAQGVVENWLQSHLSNPHFTHAELMEQRSQQAKIAARVWYNPEVESKRFLVPGAIGIVMTMIGTLLTALVVAREWERGTMESLISTPAKISEIIIGKLLPYFCLGLIACVICALMAEYLFDVPLRGSWMALLTLSSAFMIPALGQGLLISTVAKNQFIAAMMALLSAFLPAFMLSGFLFEIDSMPWLIQQITTVLAVKYYISSVQTVFIAGDIWPLFIPNILAMLGLGALFLTIAIKKTVKSLDD